MAVDDGATAPRAVEFEVATLASDTLRANVRVTGTLAPATVGLLASVLRTHVAAGRRYLRVDLDAAALDDPHVVAALVRSRREVADLGGLLVFENAGPLLVDAVRRSSLFAGS